jgi:hypothetical protein
MRTSPASLPITALLFAAAVGCHGASVPQASVAGKVSFRGMPLRGGTIVFIPDASRGSSGPLARGTIQTDGSYRLQTEDESSGAPAGWYRVTVMAIDGFAYAGAAAYVPRSLLPDKYRDPDLSGLVCEVKPGRDNQINFNLE